MNIQRLKENLAALIKSKCTLDSLNLFECVCFCENKTPTWCVTPGIAVYHELVSQLGGDYPVSLTQWELPLQFCLEGGNGACAVLLLTERCGGHFDSSHHSENLLSLSAVSPPSALLTLLWLTEDTITIKRSLTCATCCLAVLSHQASNV